MTASCAYHTLEVAIDVFRGNVAVCTKQVPDWVYITWQILDIGPPLHLKHIHMAPAPAGGPVKVVSVATSMDIFDLPGVNREV